MKILLSCEHTTKCMLTKLATSCQAELRKNNNFSSTKIVLLIWRVWHTILFAFVIFFLCSCESNVVSCVFFLSRALWHSRTHKWFCFQYFFFVAVVIGRCGFSTILIFTSSFTLNNYFFSTDCFYHSIAELIDGCVLIWQNPLKMFKFNDGARK